MNNRSKTSPVSMFIMIAVIGLAISVVNGDFNLGSYFEDLDAGSIETLLDIINMGLGFLALAGVFIFFFIRMAKGEKEYYWNFEEEQKKDEDL